MKFSILSCLLLALFAFSACGDDEDPPSTESKLLGVWLRQEYWEDIGADGDLDQIFSDGGCDLDDQFDFKTGGVIEYNDGTVHCDLFSLSLPGEWELLNNDQELSITFEGWGEVLYYTITDISETRLELDRIFPDDPNAHLPFEKLVFRR
ncbi:MAG: hypothetical protein LCH81_18580 [Bacteroidetes bacterium]|nr:hypothetical protein [Bacteroidota bacterium]